MVKRSSSEDDDGGVAAREEHTGIAIAATVLGDRATDQMRTSVMEVFVLAAGYVCVASWPIVTGLKDSGLPTLEVSAVSCTAPSTNRVMSCEKRSTVKATWCQTLSLIVMYD